MKTKIIILGNGFDLASELPTKYEDYFNYYEKLYENQLEQISGFFNNRCLYIDSEKNEVNNLNEDNESLRTTIKKIFKYEIIEILNSCMNNDISIWDIYFWNSRRNKKHINWADVEKSISHVINNIGIFTFAYNNNDICKYKLKDIDNEYINFISQIIVRKGSKLRGQSTEEYLNSICNDIDVDNRFKLLSTELLYTRYNSGKDEDYLDILKKELELFEENFRKYMTYIVENTININEENKGTYRNNFFAVTKNRTADFYILNFNYTEFSGDKKENKEYTSIQRDNNKVNLKQNNVHGTYYSKIIFGIDQTNLSNEAFFQFTKTYRKMELDNQIPAVKLPEKNRKFIDEIIFFGHSLSEADYSYFHSIFDYYDIYGSNIKLSFKYSTGRSKNEYVKNIMKLLKFYGEKMFDKSRGDNLVHKLILENRLSVEDIKLKKIDRLALKK
mgnify:CR=1 FL=1